MQAFSGCSLFTFSGTCSFLPAAVASKQQGGQTKSEAEERRVDILDQKWSETNRLP